VQVSAPPESTKAVAIAIWIRRTILSCNRLRKASWCGLFCPKRRAAAFPGNSRARSFKINNLQEDISPEKSTAKCFETHTLVLIFEENIPKMIVESCSSGHFSIPSPVRG
jgi:hypothetical protein